MKSSVLKRILALAMCVMMLCSTMNVGVFAAEAASPVDIILPAAAEISVAEEIPAEEAAPVEEAAPAEEVPSADGDTAAGLVPEAPVVGGGTSSDTGSDSGIEITEELFPDDAFRTLVENNYDCDPKNGWLSSQETAAVTTMYMGSSVADLTGIEHFTELTSLECSGSQNTFLDLSANTKLTYLCLSSCSKLTALNISGCTGLETLILMGCPVAALDVSGFTSLTRLHCTGNYYIGEMESSLTSLNAAGCTALEELIAEGNAITELDVSGCTALKELDVSGNKLGTLDVSDCTALEILDCGYAGLAALDVTKLPNLRELDCGRNYEITELDLSNNPLLEELHCDENKLTALDVAGYSALEYLYCNDNAIQSLDLSGCTALRCAFVNNNAFRTLDIGDCPDLVYAVENGVIDGSAGEVSSDIHFDADSDRGSIRFTLDEEVDILGADMPAGCLISAYRFPDSGFRSSVVEALQEYSGKSIYEYDFALFSDFEKVLELRCGWSDTESLEGLSYFPNLESLHVYADGVTEVDLSLVPNLTTLNVSDSGITELDLALVPNLTTLMISNTDISALDLASVPELTCLACEMTGIRTLDLTGNMTLWNSLAGIYPSESSYELEDGSIVYGYAYYNNNGDLILACNQDTVIIPTLENPELADMFPDAAFRTYMREQFDADENGMLSEEELEGVTGIDCSGLGIESMEGLWYLINLERLNCSDTDITELDVESCSGLRQLDCSDTAISELWLPAGGALSWLVMNVEPTTENGVTTYMTSDADGDVWLVYDEDVYLPGYDDETEEPGGEYDDAVYADYEAYMLEFLQVELVEDPLLTEIMTAVSERNFDALWEMGLYSGELLVGVAPLTIDEFAAEMGGGEPEYDEEIYVAYNEYLEDFLAEANAESDIAAEIMALAGERAYDVFWEIGLYDGVLLGVAPMTIDEFVARMGNEHDTTEDLSGINQNVDVPLTAEYFPDANFRDYIVAFDENEDGMLSYEERAAVETIECFGMGIETLRGIEYFFAARDLWCDDNRLTYVNLTANTKLTGVSVGMNLLTGIDVTGLTELVLLQLHENYYLDEVDLSTNTALWELNLGGCRMKELDISACTELVNINVSATGLTELDISHNPDLKSIRASYTDISELDLDGRSGLRELGIARSNIPMPDLTQFPNLEYLSCAGLGITELDLTAVPKLTYLSCYDNQITELDLSAVPGLESLDCERNLLTELNVAAAPNLSELWCSYNNIAALDISKNPILSIVYNEGRCSMDEETTTYEYDSAFGRGYITVDADTVITAAAPEEDDGIALTKENFPDESFREWVADRFDTNADDYLSEGERYFAHELEIEGEELADLTGIEYLTGLRSFVCVSTGVTELDLSANTALEYVEVQETPLEKLTVGKNTALRQLAVVYSELTEVNVSGCPNLEVLVVAYSNVGMVDICNCPIIAEVVSTYEGVTEEGCTTWSDPAGDYGLMVDDWTIVVSARDDLTDDGAMNEEDIEVIFHHVLLLDDVLVENEELFEVADVNGDDSVDAADATQILRYASGLPSALDIS